MSGFNIPACLENSDAGTQWSHLYALRASFDQTIPNFLDTKAAIDSLDRKIQALPAHWLENY